MVNNKALDIDALAQEIRRVDGSNSLGAGALAEALMPYLTAAKEGGEPGWQDISTAPEYEDFLAYGSVIYPGDADRTEYIETAWRSGHRKWPWASSRGFHCDGFYTHWRPLPSPPATKGGGE